MKTKPLATQQHVLHNLQALLLVQSSKEATEQKMSVMSTVPTQHIREFLTPSSVNLWGFSMAILLSHHCFNSELLLAFFLLNSVKSQACLTATTPKNLWEAEGKWKRQWRSGIKILAAKLADSLRQWTSSKKQKKCRIGLRIVQKSFCCVSRMTSKLYLPISSTMKTKGTKPALDTLHHSSVPL